MSFLTDMEQFFSVLKEAEALFTKIKGHFTPATPVATPLQPVTAPSLTPVGPNQSAPAVTPTQEQSSILESVANPVAIWDGNLIPEQMRQFVTGNWTDNQLYWALFTCYGNHVGDFSSDAADLGAQCQTIKEWFTNGTTDIGRQLKANPSMQATLIVNDANDRGGLFMVDQIRTQLLDMGINPSQLTDGQVYRP